MKSSLQYILFLLVLGLSFKVEAQNYLEIYDAASLDALPYAHVRLTELSTNKSSQAISDENGKVLIPFETATQVEFSYVGYENLTKTIKPTRNQILYVFALELEVDEVVVTGNPVEKSAKESMYEVDVITKEEIEQRAAVNLSDALMNQLNIKISQDGVLGSQINLQGMGGNNVKIMIDGVPVIGRLDGNLDLSQINMNNIERIEVVEGPLSAIYGSNAIAGVVNLITKQNQKNKVEAFVNGYYESIGTYNVDALVGFKKDRHLVQFSGGRYFFDGWDPGDYDRDVEWNPKEQYFGAVNYTYRTKQDWFHKLKANYFQDKILNRYDPAGALPVAFDDWYNTQRIDGSYIVLGQLNEHLSLNSTNAFNHYNRIKNRYQKDLTSLESTLIEDTPSADNQDTTLANQWMTRTYISYENPEKIIGVQAGIDFNIENGKGGRFEAEDGGSVLIADLAGFVSTNIQATEKLNIQPALRYAYNSQFKVIPTPSLQLKYDINEKLVYRFNYGMGFRAPSLKEMYLIFNDANHNIQGNQDLIPEQSHNASTSISYRTKKKLHQIDLNAKFFYNHKYNAIALVSDENNLFQYENIASLSTMGIQADGQYKYKNFTSNFGTSFIGISNDEEDGAKYFFSPQIQTNLSYYFQKADFTVSLFNIWNGSRKDYRAVGENNEVEQVLIQAYDLMDFTMQKGFWNKRIRISAGIKNILNVSNINSSNSTGGAHSGGTESQIASGRLYFVGLKIGTKQ